MRKVMRVAAQQCGSCQRVRYLDVKKQWSPWMQKLPQETFADSYDLILCSACECTQQDSAQRRARHRHRSRLRGL